MATRLKRTPWEAIAERLGRIRSVGIPGVLSLSWAAGDDEKKLAGAALTYLEGQGLFTSPLHFEHPKETYVAAGTVRTELTKLMQSMGRDMTSYAAFNGIRLALETFQRSVRAQKLADRESKSLMSNDEVFSYDQTLLKLRRVAAIHSSAVYVACKLQGSSALIEWLPQ